jgi:uncharacterized protein (DUF1810 family)
VTADPFDLQRFVDAQEHSYTTAIAELESGRGLGRSERSYRYGISSLAEANAYLAHPVLGPRLIACVEATLHHRNKSAEAILGSIDAQKFHSCLTLFASASPRMPCFDRALQQFFSGECDAATLAMLHNNPPA